jgi:hypothetical protein
MYIRFGPAFDIKCKNLSTDHGDNIQWAKICRYLGVYLISGRTLKCSFNQAKCKFFARLMQYSARLAGLLQRKLS